MNFVADEGVDRQIVERLRQVGHDVLSIAELAPGTSDDEILDRANAQQALLVTADKDFGELVFRLRRIHAGVVLLRLAGLAPETKAGLVVAHVQAHAAALVGAFSVISPGMVRIRPRQ